MSQRITRYFECKVDGHNKFWEISYDNPPGLGASYVTRWGQIGSGGSNKPKHEAYSLKDIERLISGKLAKGYKEIRKSTDFRAASNPPRPVAPVIPGGLEIF